MPSIQRRARRPSGPDRGPTVGSRHAAVAVLCALLAVGVWLGSRVALPDSYAVPAGFAAAWIALYPAAKAHGGDAAAAHWLGGAFVIATWLLAMFIKQRW